MNGKRLFIRGTNWIPEAMLRTSDERTYAELRYSRQSGVNLLRMWGGGIAESDYFFQLCDELGLLVWQEFWMTGDTRHPHDKALYMSNVESTVKRIRNHPSLAYYVASNESTEVTGTPELLNKLDGTRGFQMQSECEGVHDGSPYKQVNPMQHYENTASPRGSRVDGFNPEYGAPTLPTVEILREMMDEKDLWPINKEVWDYLDGNGFHLMSTMYTDLVNNYGNHHPSMSLHRKDNCWELLIRRVSGKYGTTISWIMVIVSVPDFCFGIITALCLKWLPVCGTGLWNRQHPFIILPTL